MIQGSKLELRIMRYELTDEKWAAIRPMLPDGRASLWAQSVEGHLAMKADAVKSR
jgi:transposase